MERETDLYPVKIAEETYLVHEGVSLCARVFKPVGPGPFPAIVDAHGGGWCVCNNRNNESVNITLARIGIIVAALDFRMPPGGVHPTSVADITSAYDG